MKNDAQKLLQDILFELSKKNLSEDPKAPEEYLQRLQKIYAGDFRHAYSSIFGAITRIDNSSRYDLDLLAENINLLHEYAKEKQNGAPEDEATLQFYQKIRKLYDHTNLDISRINYTKELAQRIEHENQTMTERLQKLQDKSEQSQKDYITILGIFSSIVVTFVAGLVFSGSVLNNIDKVCLSIDVRHADDRVFHFQSCGVAFAFHPEDSPSGSR
jgi:hypothetical protein